MENTKSDTWTFQELLTYFENNYHFKRGYTSIILGIPFNYSYTDPINGNLYENGRAFAIWLQHKNEIAIWSKGKLTDRTLSIMTRASTSTLPTGIKSWQWAS